VHAQLAGQQAIILGRSLLVGRPVAQLLLGQNVTITHVHSHTENVKNLCRMADIIIAATGQPHMIKADWVKPGATVIDVGIIRTATGLVGDVDFDQVRDIAGAITPVPGGVGPMTIAHLLDNTLQAALAVSS
jgi:methylenetetrahydrofolate dehydrogenase (NADP+)/methenyltetrahydrofolate cyclohydrolase